MSFANTLWDKEITREAPDSLRGSAVETDRAAATSAVNAVLEGEDRGTPLASIESIEPPKVLGSFSRARTFYLDGSL